ncbi:MAG TPA: ATP-binding protein [Planctomycetota bacterium]|nr:ATP-binding protein [Planctomycetota bacterium]
MAPSIDIEYELARYRALFEHETDAVLTLTGACDAIVEANPSGDKIFGVAPGALAGRSLADLAPDVQPDGVSSREALTRHIERSRADGAARFAWRAHRADGRQVELDVTLRPLELADGRRLVLARARDVTRQRHLEEGLRQSQKLEAVGVLAGGIAHEFNNLLTGVLGFLELAHEQVAREGERMAKTRRLLAEARRAAGRSAELTERLLQFSRRKGGNRVPLDLNETVERTRPLLVQLAGEAVGVRVVPSPLPCPILGDPAELEQLLVNLALNAREAKGETLVIETEKVESDGTFIERGPCIVLRVSDDGAGMSDSVRSRLFEPFFTTKDRSRGTGLGLAVVHGIVQRHQGRILVESEPDQGTRFTVIFPERRGETPPKRESATLPAPERKGTRKVLVVDDDPIVREVATAMLEALGYSADRVSSAGEALSAVATGLYDLVLTDVVMPDTSGVELQRRLRAERPELQVLLMSGYAQDAFAQHGVSEGDAASLLRKPLTLDALSRAVQSLLAGPIERADTVTS